MLEKEAMGHGVDNDRHSGCRMRPLLGMLAFVALAVSTCAGRQVPRTSASPVALFHGSVSLQTLGGGPPPKGNLAVYWMLPNEVRQDADKTRWSATSMRAIRNLTSRVLAFPNIDLAMTTKVDFHISAPRDALLFALLDTHQRTFNALIDGTLSGDWIGVALSDGTNDRRDILLSPVTATAVHKEQCAGPRDRLEVIDAPEVAGSIGNETKRRLCVHLPSDYETNAGRRYPVVYVLPGFSGNDSGGSVGLVFQAADEAPSERQAIFVGVNIATKFAVSYLVKSPLSGDFDSFLSERVTAFIDGKYRTIAEATSRGLIGQSTGGLGVISLALRHSDRFGIVAVSSSDALDFASWMLLPDGRHIVPLALDLLRLDDAFGPPGQMASYAADWSPDPKSRWGVRWPANPSTGEIIAEVWQRWLKQSPSELIKDPVILNAARERLSGKIYLAAGTADDFDLFAPTKLFSEELLAAGVNNRFVPDGENHGGSIVRKRGMVSFVLGTLRR